MSQYCSHAPFPHPAHQAGHADFSHPAFGQGTLTVTNLGLTGDLKRFFSTTNAIESGFSRVRQVTRRVKRWRDGGMRRRWCAAGLLRVEARFRRIRGFRDLPSLLDALGTMSVDKL